MYDGSTLLEKLTTTFAAVDDADVPSLRYQISTAVPSVEPKSRSMACVSAVPLNDTDDTSSPPIVSTVTTRSRSVPAPTVCEKVALERLDDDELAVPLPEKVTLSVNSWLAVRPL